MTLVSCRRVRKQFNGTDILKGVDLDIEVGERIGLVGPNGAGKTTLARIIAGEMSPDSGSVTFWLPSVRVGYLRQCAGNLRLSSDGYSVFTAAKRSGLDAPICESVFDNPLEMCELLRVARQLGIQHVDQWSMQGPGSLSGGERTKLALARVWSYEPDLLLLDEPTNNMDLNGIEWLIEQLNRYDGTILVISHDRHFLDQVVSRIVELDGGIVTSYNGNYSFYREEKARLRAAQLKAYETARREEERLREDIERMKRWAAKAHREAGKKSDIRSAWVGDRAKAKRLDRQVKAKIKRLERHKSSAPEKPKDEPAIHIRLQDSIKHGRRLIYAEAIAKRYGDRTLFKNSSFYVLRGDKVGIVGPNGCGKTTLLKIVMGMELPDEGEIWVSPSARIGYLPQNDSLSTASGSTLDVLGLSGKRLASEERAILAQMGIGEDLVVRPVNSLSAGERRKVAMARLVINQANLLLLDEPTNHLDIYAREQLEAALVAYDGTIVMVSHDKHMLDTVCNRILVFEDQQIRPVRDVSEPPDIDFDWEVDEGTLKPDWS